MGYASEKKLAHLGTILPAVFNRYKHEKRLWLFNWCISNFSNFVDSFYILLLHAIDGGY
jgi:hypothetical protein